MIIYFPSNGHGLVRIPCSTLSMNLLRPGDVVASSGDELGKLGVVSPNMEIEPIDHDRFAALDMAARCRANV